MSHPVFSPAILRTAFFFNCLLRKMPTIGCRKNPPHSSRDKLSWCDAGSQRGLCSMPKIQMQHSCRSFP
ncbi:MAG: hypothetical protein Ct9H300mP7_3320 [Verrucomicrobiota bacterium]|nr:MAG: hypothetical protein Ct9H300mP7_3320 [Verrucomicrobiota bacterium]